MVNRSRFSVDASLILFMAAVLPLPCAWSQTTMGVVSGTVRDQSLAVVPKAALVLTNTATNNSQSATSNEVGQPCTTPKPPISTVAPSRMQATAARALATSLSMAAL